MCVVTGVIGESVCASVCVCVCVCVYTPTYTCTQGRERGIYLANAVDVREFREEVGAVWELLHHQLHHVQQERSSVDCVLHIWDPTQVLQVEGL